MQYTTAFLAILAASGANAAPAGAPAIADQVRVHLSSSSLGTQTGFQEANHIEGRPIGSSGPYTKVELLLGANIKNKNLRCKVLDDASKEIAVVRGKNSGNTFGDGGKGVWTFKNGAAKVTKIVCDKSFTKRDEIPEVEEFDARDVEEDDEQFETRDVEEDEEQFETRDFEEEVEDLEARAAAKNNVRVHLSTSSLGGITQFTEGQAQSKKPSSGKGPYKFVELTLQDPKNPEYRCRIFDEAGKAITVTRGQNVETSFGDGGKGRWTLKAETKVSKITCSPAIKKGSA